MNYFAHGRHFLEQPYVLAGTAVPDWLAVVDRRVRVRSRVAAGFVEDADDRVAQVARGIVRHHADDDWFHRTRAFAELSLELTLKIRDLLAPDEGFRPSFLGHILVEILLDASLIADSPGELEKYYAAVESIDPAVVQMAVNRMAPRPAENLAVMISRFSQERFLFDYARDDKLLFRLNQVMRRVKLSPLPESLWGLLPEARGMVYDRRAELLAGELKQ